MPPELYAQITEQLDALVQPMKDIDLKKKIF